MKTEVKMQSLEEQLLDSEMENGQDKKSKGNAGKKVAQAAGFASVAGLGAVAAAAMSQIGDEDEAAAQPVAETNETDATETVDAETPIASTTTTTSYTHSASSHSASASSSSSIGGVEEVEVEAEIAEPEIVSDDVIVIDDSDFGDVAFVEPILDDEVELVQIADNDVHVEPIDIESIIIEDVPMIEPEVADVFGMDNIDVEIEVGDSSIDDFDMAYGDDVASVDMF